MSINTKKDINTVVLYQIDKTSKVAKHYSQMIFDKLNFGITVDQWVLLKIVEESDSLSQRDLAEKSMRDPASITRTVDILEKKKLLRRVGDLNDRRRYTIELTRQGAEFIEKYFPFVMQQRQQSVKGFSRQELETLFDLLGRIQKNMM